MALIILLISCFPIISFAAFSNLLMTKLTTVLWIFISSYVIISLTIALIYQLNVLSSICNRAWAFALVLGELRHLQCCCCLRFKQGTNQNSNIVNIPSISTSNWLMLLFQMMLRTITEHLPLYQWMDFDYLHFLFSEQFCFVFHILNIIEPGRIYFEILYHLSSFLS